MGITTGCLDFCRAFMAGNVKPITGNWDILTRAEVVTVKDKLSAMYSRGAVAWACKQRPDLFQTCVGALEGVEAAFRTRRRGAIRRAAADAVAARQVLLTAYTAAGTGARAGSAGAVPGRTREKA